MGDEAERLTRAQQRTRELEEQIAGYKAEIDRYRRGIEEAQARGAIRDELIGLGVKYRGEDVRKLGRVLRAVDMTAVRADEEGRVLGTRQEALRLQREFPEFFMPGHRSREEHMKTEVEKKAAELRQRVEAARVAYNREIEACYHKMDDGTMVPKFDEDRVREIVGRARDQRADKLREIEAQADELTAEVQRHEERLLDYSPTAILGSGDRQAAAELLPLVTAEAMALDADALARRLEHLLDSDDSIAVRYAYHVAARQRRRAILEGRSQGTSGSPRQAPRAETSITPLDGPLEKLGEKLFAAENERRTSEIKAARDAASDVAGAAYLLRHDAGSSAGLGRYHRPPGRGPKLVPAPDIARGA